MKPLITVCGATGFIGRNMVEAFAKSKQYRVRGVYHQRQPFTCEGVEWVKADLTNNLEAAEALKGTDILVQAAATTSGAKDIITRPYIHIADNAVINSLLFRAAFDLNIKHVIFFSCSIMYPSSSTPLKESDFDANREISPNYFGGAWTKVYLEKMAEFYSRLGKNRFTVIRHSNIYGPHDKFDLEKSHVLGATLTKVLSALPTDDKITVWGDGSEERDLLYISDLVDFVSLAIQKQKEPYFLVNIGVGKSISVKELVLKCVAASGKKLKLEFDLTKPSLKTKILLDTSRARDFGWIPKVDLEKGLEQTLTWLQNQSIFKSVA